MLRKPPKLSKEATRRFKERASRIEKEALQALKEDKRNDTQLDASKT